MAKTSSLHIRIEPQIKERAEKILNGLGMTAAEAINIYLRQIILNVGIPFEIKAPDFDEDLLEALEEAEKMEKHPENYKKYHSVKELMEGLKD